MQRLLLVLVGVSLAVMAQAGGSRSYRLGLADNPYDISAQAVLDTWGYIARDSDLIVYHDDRGGVPWTEAYWGLPYPAEFQGRIDVRRQAQQHLWNTHKRYLAVTPLNFTRTNIADQFDAKQHPDWQAFWSSQKLNSDVVKTAYYNHLSRLIEVYQPHYLAYAVEANIFINTQPQRWAEFVELVAEVYGRLKQAHPQLTLMITFQVDAFYEGITRFPDRPALHAQAMAQVFPFTEVMALSSYPYLRYKKPDRLPATYFSLIADLAPQKPLAIAETGWAAEPLEVPYNVAATPWDQRQYLKRVMDEVQSRHGLFVIGLLPRDYDAIWDSVYQHEPDAFLLRIWRDMGLYDGAGNERPALRLWRQRLALPLLGVH